MALAERKALQRALGVLRFYQGPDDGALSFQVRAAVRDFQRSLDGPVTGYLTVEQLVEVHRQARSKRPPSELPDHDLIQVLRESEAGNADAQLLRGMLHDTAYELTALPKDDQEAARWYRRAADAGRAEAAREFGAMLGDGRGAARDPAEAVQRLRAAVGAGLDGARLPLAELLLEAGETDEAVRLLRAAAAEEIDGPEAIARLRLLGAWEEREAAPVATSR